MKQILVLSILQRNWGLGGCNLPRNIKLSGQARTGTKLKAWARNLTHILWPMSLSLGLIHCLNNKFWCNILHLSFALKSLRTLSGSYFIKINHLPQTLPLYYISVNHPLLPPCYPYYFSAINFICWSQQFLLGVIISNYCSPPNCNDIA